MAKSREEALASHDQGEAQLRRRITELEAETARLRQLLREAQAPSGPSEPKADPGPGTNRPASSQYKQVAEILDASADAILSVDARGMLNRFNKGAEVIFGYRSSEVIGRPLDILIPARFRKDHRKHMAKFDRAPESSRLMNDRGEIFGLRKDGTEFPAEASIVKLEAGGRPVFTVIMRDITERKAADAAIRASEELLKSVLDNLPAATHIKGTDGRYTMVNPEYERQFGVRAADIIGRTVAEVYPEQIAAQVVQQDKEVLEGPAGAEYEFEIVDNIEDRVILTMKRRLTDAEGKSNAILSAETDITERQKIQAAIREREAQLRQAQNMAQIGTFVWDETADCCEFCSDELAAILGFTPEKLIEASKSESWLIEQIYPDDRDRYRAIVSNARKTASSYDVEFQFRRDDGEIIHLREMGEPEKDAGGRIVRTFGTLQDITQIRHAEETLRQNESLLRQAQRLSRIGAYVWDVVTDTCIFCSDELAELFGMSAQEFIATRGSGAKYQKFVHPDDLTRYAESAVRSAGNAIPYDIEYRAVIAHGEVRHFREVAENIVNKDGKMTRCFGTLQDVTHLRHAEQALRQSEYQLRQAHRMARVGTFSWDDKAGVCLDCSSELADLFAMSVQEFMEKRGTDEKYVAYLHPDDVAGFWDTLERAGRDISAYDMEYRCYNNSGRLLYFREIGEPNTDTSGELLNFFCTLQDITHLRQAEVALQQSEEQFRSLIEGSIQGVLVQHNFKPQFVNQAFADMFGYDSPEEVIALGSIIPMIAEEERSRVMSIAESRRKFSKAPSQYEFQGVRKDGTRIWLENRGNLVNWSGETAILAVMVDITERHEAQVALQENEKQLRTITDNLPAFIAYTDKDQRLQFVNQTVTQWYAGTRENLIGRRAKDVLGKDDYARAAPRFAEILEGKTVKSEETRTFPDGVTRHIDNTSVPNIGPDGQVLGWFSLITDITERKLAEEALREREEQLRAITDNIPAFVVYMDKDYRFRFANRLAEEWYGRPASEIVGFHANEILGAESFGLLKARINAALSGENVRFEEIRHFPGGSTRSLDISYVPDIGEDGQVRGFFALLLDITERRRAEDALRRTLRSADLLRQIATASNEAETAERALAHCLDAIGRHGGWHLADVFILADDRSGDMVPAGLWWTDKPEAFAAFRDSTENVRFKPGEGLPGRVAISAKPAWIEDVRSDGNFPRSEMPGAQEVGAGFAFPVLIGQQAVAVLEFFSKEVREPDRNQMDIAVQAGTILGRAIERQRAERALRDSEEHIRLMTDNIPVLITYLDCDMVFRFANRTTEEWYARPAAELIGKQLVEQIGKAGFARMAPYLERALGGETVHLEELLAYPDGKTRNIDATYVPHFGPQGSVRGIFTMVVDITDRLHAEEQLRHAQRMEAIGKLTGGVAHDFNNLLAVIMGNSEIVRDQLGEANPAVRAITHAAQRGSDLTRRLLAFSRQQPLRPRAADLARLAGEMAGILSRTLGETISIVVKPARRKWLARVDIGELENAVLNLAINARDAMPDGGTLTITTENIELTANKAARLDDAKPGKYVRLSVADTGTGMSADVMAHAFEPFFTTKTFGDGSGLGLSMVYGFATQSGGFTTIDSAPGEGTTVSIYLPRAEAADEPEQDCRPLCQPVGQGGTILVVEDDPDVRKLTVTLLKAMGYTVLEADDGESAIPLLAADRQIDLLLSDVVLTGEMSGPAIAEAALEMRPNLRIMFMSGYAEDVIRRDRGERGKVVDADLLSKPFTRAQLAEKVRAALKSETEDR